MVKKRLFELVHTIEDYDVASNFSKDFNTYSKVPELRERIKKLTSNGVKIWALYSLI